MDHKFSPTVSEREETSSDEEEASSDLLVEIKQAPKVLNPPTVNLNIPMQRHARNLLAYNPRLDEFLQKVYLYYTHKGFWCIVTEKILNLMYNSKL